MEANLQSDFQVIEGFLCKVQEIIDSVNPDAERKLAEKLLKHYSARGTLDFRTVPAQYAKEVKDTLIRYGIPFMGSLDSAGNTVFMLPPDGEEYHYGHHLEEVFMHHPEYYKQLELLPWTRLAKADGVQNVICFKFRNRVDGEIFKNKAFAEGKGIVTADILHQDGGMTVFCRDFDLVNDTEYQDAADALIDTEVSLGNQSLARRFAVHHDLHQVDKCMQYLKNNTCFVIHDGAQKKADYLQYMNGVFTYNRYDKESNTFATRDIPIETADEGSLRKFLEHHMSFIHNSYVSAEQEFKAFQGRSESYIRNEYVQKQKLFYREILLDPDLNQRYEDYEQGNRGASPFRGGAGVDHLLESFVVNSGKLSRYGLEDVRPDFSVDFLTEMYRELQSETDSLQEEADEKMKTAHMELKDRIDTFYTSLGVAGIVPANGKSVKNCSLAEIMEDLQAQYGLIALQCEHACRQMEGELFPERDIDKILFFSAQGVQIPELSAALRLSQKAELSQGDMEKLKDIAAACMIEHAGRHDPNCAKAAMRAKALKSKRIDASALFRFISAKQEEIGALQRDAAEGKVRKQEALNSLKTMIDVEKENKEKIRGLQDGCHQILHRVRVENPRADAGTVLGNAIGYLRQAGVKLEHTDVTVSAFGRFEDKVRQHIQEAGHAEGRGKGNREDRADGRQQGWAKR